MSRHNEEDTDQLIRRAADGDRSAADDLLVRHRQRLKYMVTVRLDRRLAGRVDPSDVVQETLIDAARRLDTYLHERPMPFYPWLRGLAWNRMIDLHRRHVSASKRSVDREVHDLALSDQSADVLAQQLVAPGTDAFHRVVRDEWRERVQRALDQLPDAQREIVLMRHVERMSVAEIAAVIGVAEGTVKSRVFRALARLQGLLSATNSEGPDD